jgi:hypothetical protein
MTVLAISTSPAAGAPKAVKAAPDRVGQFSVVTGPGRVKVQRVLRTRFRCSTPCDIAWTVRLIRPGGDIGFGKKVVFEFNPARTLIVGQVVLFRPVLERLKREAAKTKMRIFATVRDSFDPTRVDQLQRDIRFKRPPRRRGGGGGGGGACAPGYSPCLPVVGDLDCDDIPESKKPVRVTGSDQYRLDADGDGLGCE